MQRRSAFVRRRRERGQTIILVAISIVSLLAMAALAIDVVTLYSASSETQRAADAAALAGAKALADSGITTLSTGDLALDTPQIQTLAINMATSAISATLPANVVAGSAPTVVGSPAFNFSTSQTTPAINNPTVTVTLQRTGLPTFFAHIWGRTAATVSASATAEAYNPANLASFTPITPKCVKPWLVANADPLQGPGLNFITASTGAINTGVVGEQFDLTSGCNGSNPNSCPLNNPPPPPWTTGNAVYYLPALVQSPPNSADICPSCEGSDAYENSIECCDQNTYSYVNCGPATGGNAQWNSGLNPEANGVNDLSPTGAECLIGTPGSPGVTTQDSLDKTLWPAGPFKIKANSGPQSGNFIGTSRSIATIPIFDSRSSSFNPGSANVIVVGFLQAFINCVEDGTHKNCDQSGSTSTPGDINITVLNVVGCSSTPNSNPTIVGYGGAGSSPIPVRLISP